MSFVTIETVNQLFTQLKANPEIDTSAVCEQMLEWFPILPKEAQKTLAADFSTWAEKYKTKRPLIFTYARLLILTDNFFGEQYETVLSEAPGLQKTLLDHNEQAASVMLSVLIGSTHRTLGNIDLSLKLLWDSHGQLNKLNRFHHYKMASSFVIGSIYMDLNNHEEALPILKNTLSQAEQRQDTLMTVYTSFGLGKLYLKQKKYESARVMFQDALDTAQNTGIPSMICSAQTEMGNYYFETGNYDESEALHTRAAEARISNQIIGGAITNYIRLSEINIRQSQPDEAIAVLNKGLALAEQIKVKPKMYQIHLLLSDIYHCKNDMGKSLFHYKQYHHLQEEVGLEDNAKRIRNVKLVFEAEQTKKENAVIKQQKAEIQKKNIELQHTIDELTLTKVGKKAKAFTLLIAIVFFIFEDSILHFVFHLLPAHDFWVALCIKGVIIFSLKPINSAIEHYLIRKVIRKKKKALEEEEEYMSTEASSGLDFVF